MMLWKNMSILFLNNFSSNGCAASWGKLLRNQCFPYSVSVSTGWVQVMQNHRGWWSQRTEEGWAL